MLDKIGSFMGRHWYWFLFAAFAVYLFHYADSKVKVTTNNINIQQSIQNAVVDEYGTVLPGKDAIFKSAQTKISDAKSEGSFYRPLFYISAGFICLFLIIITASLMAYSFTEFKFLSFLALFNKTVLGDDEHDRALYAFQGNMIILMIAAATWIPLTLIYIKSISQ